jgi:hypothetical protein
VCQLTQSDTSSVTLPSQENLVPSKVAPQASGARHVLRQDGRIPGNVLADMAGEVAGVEVVAAADRKPDGEVDGLALVELLDALRLDGGGGGGREHQQAGERSNGSHQ